LLVCSSIGETLFTGLGGRDNTGTLDKGVGQGGFTMVDWNRCQLHSVVYTGHWMDDFCQVNRRTVSNDGHVPDVGRTVHQGPDLISVVSIVVV
jgi:hypothetical protein